jgi:1,4-alpha-glucan branching enzyme
LEDLYLFREGNLFRTHGELGARAGRLGGAKGVHFSVWALNASGVSVLGDFNGWQ